MIRSNIDVIAVAVLLAAIAVYSQARRLMLIEVIPHQRIVLAHDFVDRLAVLPPEAPLPPLPTVVLCRQ